MSKETTVPVAGLIVAGLVLAGLLALSLRTIGWVAPFPQRPRAVARRAVAIASGGLSRRFSRRSTAP